MADTSKNMPEKENLSSSESVGLYKEVLSAISDAVFVTDEHGELTFICPNAHTIFGEAREHLWEKKNISNILGQKFAAPEFTKIEKEIINQLAVVQDAFGNEKQLLVNVKPISIEEGCLLFTCRDASDWIRERERERHITAVLKAIRNVNQLITQESDPGRLLQKSCENLVETLGYHNAWTALFDDDGSVSLTASSGFNGEFREMERALHRGELPQCVEQATQTDAVVAVGAPARSCADCPLAHAYGTRAGFCTKLAFQGKTYGTLTVSVPGPLVDDPEERDLFRELASDLSFALWKIESERRHQRTVFLKAESEAKYSALFDHMREGVCLHGVQRDDGGRITNYRILEANPSFERLLGIPLTDAVGRTATEVYGTDAPPFLDVYEKVVETGDSVVFETYFPPLGKHFHISAFRPEPGKFATVFQDVTERVEARESLRDREAQLREAQRIAHIGRWELDLASGGLHWSDSIFDIFEIDPDKFGASYEAFLAVVHPKDREKVDRVFNDAVAKGDGYDIEHRLLLSAGRIKWVREKCRFEKDDAGKVVKAVGVVQDVTESVTHHETLQRAYDQTHLREREVSALLDSAQAVLETGSFDGAARRIFDACRKATGAASGYVALLSSDGSENEVLFLESGGLPCSVDPSLPMPIRGLRAEAYRTGQVVFDNDFEKSEWMAFMPTGHVDLRNVLFAPLIIEGDVVGLLGIANKPGGFDDNDVRMAEAFGRHAAIALQNVRNLEALSESESKYRTYVDTSPVAIFIADDAGRYIDANRAAGELLGYEREELLGLSIPDLASSLPGQDARTLFEEQKRKGCSSVEVGLRHKSGSVVHVALQAVALPGGRHMAFCSDITERLALEQQLRQSQKMEAVGKLAGGIAHDFNNLMMIVVGYTALLLDKEGIAPFRATVEQIRRAGEKATTLTRQLLAFSRKQILKPEILRPDNLLYEMEKMLGRLIGEDIEIVVHAEPPVGRVKVDPGQIEQVLVNLAVNARDAMPEGGKLTLEVENVTLDAAYAQEHLGVASGAYVRFVVCDTGCGMDEATRARIFEPFFTTKGPDRGTGLGLSTVYGIVRQSGGHVYVYSEPGEGTCFKMYFPRIQTIEEKRREARSSQRPLVRGGETVLIVEDDPGVRAVTRDMLEAAGYTVLDGGDGSQIETVCRDLEATGEQVDLVLTDVVMPEFSGPEVVKIVKKTFPHAAALFMSGYTDNAIVHHGVLDEGVDFIEKPFHPVRLAAKVRDTLDQHHPE